MLKKLLPYLLLPLIALGLYFIWKSLRYEQSFHRSDSYGVYKFKKLHGGVIARAGDINIKAEQVLDAQYTDLVERKNGLLAALAYEQIVEKHQYPSATFGLPKPSRPFEDICNMYGIVCKNSDEIFFDPQQKEFLKTGDKVFQREDVFTENLHWHALKTETFNHVLENVERELRKKALEDMSFSTKTPSLEIIESKIIPAAQVDAEAKAMVEAKYAKTGGLAAVDKANFIKMESDRIRNQAIDLYIQKNYLKLPLEVSIELPDMSFEMRWDWVAHIGNSRSPIRVIFISDYMSAAGKDVIAHIEDYSKKWPNVVFGHRPFFSRSDRYQIMLGEMGLCVWNMYSPQYWNFLNRASTLDQKTFETDLYKILDELKINSAEIKQCFLSRKYKDAMEYHLKWAEHFKILTGPVTIIGREVYIGPVDAWVMAKILSRQ